MDFLAESEREENMFGRKVAMTSGHVWSYGEGTQKYKVEGDKQKL